MAKKNQEVWNCLSVRQPHAWAIMVGAKDVENRKRRCYYLGQLYIHAGLTEDVDAVEEITERVAAHLGISAGAARTRYRRHRERGLGAIIGHVQMFGCAVSHESEVRRRASIRLLAPRSRAAEATDSRQGFHRNPVQVQAMNDVATIASSGG